MSASFGRISELKPAPDLVTFGWLLGSLTLAVLPHLSRLPPWLPLVFLLAVAERSSHFWWKRRPVPGWLRLLFTLGCVVGVGATYGTILGRQAGVALLCTMLSLKLLETYRKRDVFLLISLAYFIVITQFLFDQSVYLAAYLVLVAVVITATLIVNEAQPSRQLSSVAPMKIARDTLRSAGWMLLQGLPLMILLFLLFPRLTTPIWGVPEDALYGKTGISDRMEPGSIRELFVDDSPAFRVDFLGPKPRKDQLYWRGPVLWHFDGSAWCRSPPCAQGARRSTPLIGVIPSISGDVDDPLRYQVTMEPSQQHWLFALDTPVVKPSGFMALERDYTLHHRRPVTRTLTYTMTSDAGYLKNNVSDQWGFRRAGLQLPDNRNPQTLDLATQLRARYGEDDRALVQAVLRRFRNEGYSYSFTPPPLGVHTVDDFLFSTKEGYCEYYSSAFTFLMRAAGIPARVVTGYQGGDYNGDPEYLLVRQSDAHAWSEVLLKDVGWVRVDPTAAVAPDRVDLGALQAARQRRGWFDFPWVRRMSNQLDAVHRMWTDWVLKFDQARQRSLLRPMGIDDLNVRSSVLLLTGAMVSVIALVMWLLLRVQWLGGLDPVAREYARFCRKLARHGVPRQPWEGPVDFAHRAARAFTPAAGAISRITHLYIDQRYRRGSSHPEQLKQLRHAVQQLKLA